MFCITTNIKQKRNTPPKNQFAKSRGCRSPKLFILIKDEKIKNKIKCGGWRYPLRQGAESIYSFEVKRLITETNVHHQFPPSLFVSCFVLFFFLLSICFSSLSSSQVTVSEHRGTIRPLFLITIIYQHYEFHKVYSGCFAGMGCIKYVCLNFTQYSFLLYNSNLFHYVHSYLMP